MRQPSGLVRIDSNIIDSRVLHGNLNHSLDSNLEDSAESRRFNLRGRQTTDFGPALSNQISFGPVLGQQLENLDDEHQDGDENMIPDQPETITIEEVDGGTTDIFEQCAICQEELNKRDCESAYIECMHWYHFGCIKSWLIRKSECPTCKHPSSHIFKIYDESKPLTSEGEPEDSKHPEQSDHPLASSLSANAQEPVDGTESTSRLQVPESEPARTEPGRGRVLDDDFEFGDF